MASGPSGAVETGNELTVEEAIQRRGKGLDIVVTGPSSPANRALARKIEAGVGPPTPLQFPEAKAGPHALPHFHQDSRDPIGHSFYETEKRKARKRS